MMYKIMGLNSVMSAFAMSALTLDGVKLGDGQTAVESLCRGLYSTEMNLKVMFVPNDFLIDLGASFHSFHSIHLAFSWGML